MKNIVFALVIAVFAFASVAEAQNVTSARQGTVITVQWSQATPSQSSYNNYNGYNNYNAGYYQQAPQPQRSYVGASVGGTIGGIVGAIAGRHSNTGRWYGPAAGAAIGAAIGNRVDQRREAQQVRYYQQAQYRQAQYQQAQYQQRNMGAQVIVDLGHGNTVAVFVQGQGATRFYPGQRVWLVGQDQLVAAN